MNQVIQSIDVRDKSSIDGAVNNFTTMLNDITSECKQQVCVNSRRTNVNKEDKPWFDNECKNLYNIYKTDLRRFNLYKSEGNRIILCESRMKYEKNIVHVRNLNTNSQRVIKFIFLERRTPRSSISCLRTKINLTGTTFQIMIFMNISWIFKDV